MKQFLTVSGVAMLGMSCVGVSVAHAEKIYWTDFGTDKIQRANFDGSGIEDLVTVGLAWPYGLALDLSEGKMYWLDRGTDKIQRANLDGSGIEDLLSTGDYSARLALDLTAGKLYWTHDVDQYVYSDGKIKRADLDGVNEEDLVTGLATPVGIALDVGDNKMYWADGHHDHIQRANLDGTKKLFQNPVLDR